MSVDTALQNLEITNRPIRVGMVGAGATGLVAIANRTLEHGERAFREAGFSQWARVESAGEAERKIAQGVPVLTDNPSLLTACNSIDILLEVTGTVEAAARVVLDAFSHRKHVVLVNAELDSR